MTDTPQIPEGYVAMRMDFVLDTMVPALTEAGFTYYHCPDWQGCGEFAIVPTGDAWACPTHNVPGQTAPERDPLLDASDYWSDRQGVVELVGAPEDVTPSDALVDALLAECGDCNPNLSMRWLGTEAPDAPERALWHVTFAHDGTCPNVDRLAGETDG